MTQYEKAMRFSVSLSYMTQYEKAMRFSLSLSYMTHYEEAIKSFSFMILYDENVYQQ
jgi:hypothetical protein